MYPKVMPTNGVNQYQQGSALIIAVFIIVIMTLLGTALVRMISSSAETVVYEVLGIRAYQAAQSGLQRKLVEVFPLEPANGDCKAPVLYDFSAIQGLENCQAINVGCTESVILDVTYYTITSTGRCEVGGVLTTRVLEVKARRL
ncbi:MAG: pilus assembly PilX N-terminal domain-containing protein [Colwellia sp.]|nr:pilus assembly PilX N-terminal domain-containing protein [Colwellia sp.]